MSRLAVIAGAGAAFGGALLVRPELAMIAVVAAIWMASEVRWDRRRLTPRAVAFAAPLAMAVIVMFAYNYTRFGDIRDTGYLRDSGAGFNALPAMWEGFLGLLVSPGRSMFLYSPVLLAGGAALWRLRKADRSTAVLLGVAALVCFVFYGSLLYWDADRSYGPRYLVPIIPLLCLPLVHTFADATRRRRLAWIVGLSVLVQIPGVAIDFSKALPALDVQHPLLERRWNWRVSGLVLNARALARFAPDNARYLAGVEAPPPVRAANGADVTFSDQFGFSLDFWWLYLFYFGKLPALVALLAPAALLAGAAMSLQGTRKRSTIT
jgi:hypothetical protein